MILYSHCARLHIINPQHHYINNVQNTLHPIYCTHSAHYHNNILSPFRPFNKTNILLYYASHDSNIVSVDKKRTIKCLMYCSIFCCWEEKLKKITIYARTYRETKQNRTNLVSKHCLSLFLQPFSYAQNLILILVSKLK